MYLRSIFLMTSICAQVISGREILTYTNQSVALLGTIPVEDKDFASLTGFGGCQYQTCCNTRFPFYSCCGTNSDFVCCAGGLSCCPFGYRCVAGNLCESRASELSSGSCLLVVILVLSHVVDVLLDGYLAAGSV